MNLNRFSTVLATLVSLSSPLVFSEDAKGFGAGNSADNVAYDYIGLQYLMQDWNGCDQDGPQVYGSGSVNDSIFITASVSDVDGDYCGSTAVTVGAGYHAPLNQQFDWYGSLSYSNIDWGQGDDNGLIAEGGLRGFILERLESRVLLNYVSIGEGDLSLGAGLAYWFDPKFAATADINLGGDVDGFQFGIRYAF